jgi:chemotaxis protein methyltransferase CheR
MHPLTDQEFSRFQRFLNVNAGIALSNAKRSLVSGRLEKRLRELSLESFSEYLRRIADPAHSGEAQMAIDLLTTNETYFFREPKHFEVLRAHALRVMATRGEFRVWSAACSSGEEAYSAAMVLADCLGLAANWSMLGTDISTRVLARAARGHYPLARIEHLPEAYLRRYCLRGVGKQTGTMLVDRALRQRVTFQQLNLSQKLPAMPRFDLIFLRNVMIYFGADTKRDVVERMVPLLQSDGHFLVGHSESLNGVTELLKASAPACYVHA